MQACAEASHKRRCTHRMGIRNIHDGTMQGSAMQTPQRIEVRMEVRIKVRMEGGLKLRIKGWK